MNKVLLIILDGYGIAKDANDNAVTRSKSPFLHKLLRMFSSDLYEKIKDSSDLFFCFFLKKFIIIRGVLIWILIKSLKINKANNYYHIILKLQII